jgi:membrane protein DedA with SNARE-associated domain
MPWRRFFVANALGGFAWSAGYGFAAYLLGRSVTQIAGPIGVVLAVVAGAVVLGSAIFIKRHEASLVAEAERTLPGPLRQ